MIAHKRLISTVTTLALGATLALAGPTLADDSTKSGNNDLLSTHPTGWYVAFGGAIQKRGSAKEKTGVAKTSFDEGFGLNGAIGYRFPEVRVEFEYSYLDNGNDLETLSPDSPSAFTQKADGNVGLTAYMFNVYHDFYLPPAPRLRPYLGAGIGTFQSRINGLTSAGLEGGTDIPGVSIVVDTASAWQLAYQFRVGVSYALDHQTEVYAGYRLFKGSDYLRFDTPTLGTLRPNGPGVDALEVGLRVNI